jgi:hypothetical protein
MLLAALALFIRIRSISKHGTHFEMEYLLEEVKISQNIHPKCIESVKGK